LIARRQAALWTGWRPWLVLAGLVFPLGFVFWHLSRNVSDQTAVVILPYARDWQWHDLSNAVFRQVLFRYAGSAFIEYCGLFCWSWSIGFVLGSASRRSRPAHGILFGLLSLFGGFALGSGPLDLELPENRLHSAVPETAFYQMVLPAIVRACLVLIPLLWGMARSSRIARHRPTIRSTIWISAAASLGLIALWSLIRILLIWKPLILAGPSAGWLRRLGLLPLVVYWPAAYLLIDAIQRHWHGRIGGVHLSQENL